MRVCEGGPAIELALLLHDAAFPVCDLLVGLHVRQSKKPGMLTNLSKSRTSAALVPYCSHAGSKQPIRATSLLGAVCSGMHNELLCWHAKCPPKREQKLALTVVYEKG